jgi:uncharacterized OsmC-like protein/alpha/beta superfamily hydrolase
MASCYFQANFQQKSETMSASKMVHFENEQGEKLHGQLDLPLDQKPIAYALFAHCFTCGKNLLSSRSITLALTAQNIAVLRFDFTGLGKSEGDFANTGFSSNIQDLVSAANFLRTNYEAPALLIGHSLGGAAVLYAGKAITSTKAIATIGAPSDPIHVTHLLGDDAEKIQTKGEATVNIGGRPFKLKKQFIDDLHTYDLPSYLKDLKIPLLIMHSPQDAIVNIKNAAELYSSAFHPKSFISLDGADHLLSSRKDAHYVGCAIAAWAARYLPEELEQSELATKHQAAARIDDEEGYQTEIKAGNHAYVADEPAQLGGTDFGPSPYEMLAASLAACTAMTLKIYAKRKDWPLVSAEVHVDHGQIHHADAESGEEKKIDLFSKEIIIEGPLSEEQRKRLKYIASRCPVHLTLLNQIQIESEFK